MKTNLFSKAMAAAALAFMLLAASESKAQITVMPYNLNNTTGCTFIINYQVANKSCASVCSSGSSVIISPGVNALSWSCSPLPACDFKIQVTNVGAATLSPSANNSVLNGMPVTFSTPATAGPSCPNSGYTLTMSTGGATIN